MQIGNAQKPDGYIRPGMGDASTRIRCPSFLRRCTGYRALPSSQAGTLAGINSLTATASIFRGVSDDPGTNGRRGDGRDSQ